MLRFSGRRASCLVMRGQGHSIRSRLAASRRKGTRSGTQSLLHGHPRPLYPPRTVTSNIRGHPSSAAHNGSRGPRPSSQSCGLAAIGTRLPCPPTAVWRRASRARAADPRCPQNASHPRPRAGDPFLLAQVFRQMHVIEPHVPLGCERDDRLPALLSPGIDRHPPPIAGHQRRHPVPPEPGQQSLRLSFRERQPFRRSRHRHCPPHDLREDDDPSLFLNIHHHVLYGVTVPPNSYRVSES